MLAVSKYQYLHAFKLPLLVIGGFYLGGWWNLMPVGFVFMLLPVIDQWIGLNKTNVPSDQIQAVESDRFYRNVTFLWALVQTSFVLWAIWGVANGGLNTILDWTGFVLGSAIVSGGIGITVAHELGHKKSGFERFLSKVLLMQTCYMHFFVEHNRGHHVNVATPQDPATARANQNFYSFWMQSVFVGYLHAWKLEADSQRNKGKPAYGLGNAMYAYTLLPILFCAWLTLTAYLLNKPAYYAVPIFFFAQSVAAFTLLELVNYIEHYGITRKQLPNGRFERVNPLHSWNASHQLSNYYLFQLQRHSDHHDNAIKRYQVLKHYDESPQLPFGYPTMIMMALIPPLWFSMMNPRLNNWLESAVWPATKTSA